MSAEKVSAKRHTSGRRCIINYFCMVPSADKLQWLLPPYPRLHLQMYTRSLHLKEMSSSSLDTCLTRICLGAKGFAARSHQMPGCFQGGAWIKPHAMAWGGGCAAAQSLMPYM